MGGWLTTRPTKEGLVFLDGPVWNDFPNGSSRLAAGLLDTRIERIRSEEGKPDRPDWNQLKELRNAMHHSNMFEQELARIKDEDAREARRQEMNEEWEATDELPVKGFLDLTAKSLGEAIFEDQQEKPRQRGSSATTSSRCETTQMGTTASSGRCTPGRGSRLSTRPCCREPAWRREGRC